MITRNYPQKAIEKDIIGIVSKYLDINDTKIFFFGSRVFGIKNDRSDIDLGIEYRDSIDLRILSKIKEDIDNLNTLYTVDLVDFKTVSEDFKNVALKKIIPINRSRTNLS
ncbi:MAG: nucleotidyltransferase family protein [Patescibacteria group bacterium]